MYNCDWVEAEFNNNLYHGSQCLHYLTKQKQKHDTRQVSIIFNIVFTLILQCMLGSLLILIHANISFDFAILEELHKHKSEINECSKGLFEPKSGFHSSPHIRH